MVAAPRAPERAVPIRGVHRGRPLDRHAALSYDAAYTAVVAISYLAPNRVAINGGTLSPALMSVTDAADAQRRYRGATGAIDFGGTIGPVTAIPLRTRAWLGGALRR